MSETGIFSSNSKLMQVMEWLTKMLHVQVLWILFSLLGLVIGGLFPATFVMFAIIRKWIREQDGFLVFRTYKQLYKACFLKANLLGWGMALLGIGILYYLNLFSTIGGAISKTLFVITFTFFLLYLIAALFIIPVYVHFDISIPEVVRHAGIIAVSHPLHVLLMVVTFIGFWFAMQWLPVLLPFIGFSVLSYFLMRVANAAFISIEKKMSKQDSLLL